jgi:hypothetical protein
MLAAHLFNTFLGSQRCTAPSTGKSIIENNWEEWYVILCPLKTVLMCLSILYCRYHRLFLTTWHQRYPLYVLHFSSAYAVMPTARL